MSGNVDEWCWDWDRYGGVDSSTPGSGVPSGSDRCLRSGSWFYEASYVQVNQNYNNRPSYRYNTYGFRLVRFAQ